MSDPNTAAPDADNQLKAWERSELSRHVDASVRRWEEDLGATGRREAADAAAALNASSDAADAPPPRKRRRTTTPRPRTSYTSKYYGTSRTLAADRGPSDTLLIKRTPPTHITRH
mmetsp:Transcript_18426/g.57566  ORF Transcript_18426/g.57566 Transcript_18426/m.57566 type:complete len:115 (-) Transcript_18426:465-809(-)